MKKISKVLFFHICFSIIGGTVSATAAAVPSQKELNELLAAQLVSQQMSHVYEIDSVVIHKGFPQTQKKPALVEYRMDVSVKTKEDCFKQEVALDGSSFPECRTQAQIEEEKKEQIYLQTIKVGRPDYNYCDEFLKNKPARNAKGELQNCKAPLISKADVQKKIEDIQKNWSAKYPQSSLTKAGSVFILKNTKFTVYRNDQTSPSKWEVLDKACFFCF